MRRAGLALALLLVFPASAAAQTPPEPTLTVTAQDVFGGKRPMALTGRSFTARVVLKPYIAGETVTVRLYRGSRKLRNLERREFVDAAIEDEPRQHLVLR